MTQTAALSRKSVLKSPQTVEEFEQWLIGNKLKRGFEFRNGIILEKDGVQPPVFYIISFIQNEFLKTKSHENGFVLLPRVEFNIDDFRRRICDFGLFTKSQIKMMTSGKEFIPNFIIEILQSEIETEVYISDKIQDYFDAGVQVVWYISPKKKLIYVYTSPSDVKIYKGEQICHAKPALPDFEFKTEDLFIIPTI